jgi:hypothetical protein
MYRIDIPLISLGFEEDGQRREKLTRSRSVSFRAREELFESWVRLVGTFVYYPVHD